MNILGMMLIIITIFKLLNYFIHTQNTKTFVTPMKKCHMIAGLRAAE